MTDEEISTEIAKACGWKWDRHSILDGSGWRWPRFHPMALHVDQLPYLLPDYPNDLNATMEAARYFRDNVLDSDGWEKYGKLIQDAHPTALVDYDYHDFATLIVETTPRTHCECLLKAAGLWKEDK